MQYTKVRDNFASVVNLDGRRIGFEFLNIEDQNKFEGLLGPLNELQRAPPNYSEFLDQINEGRGALYFICVLIHRHEQSATRGSIVKSLALCSKSKCVEPFKRILLMALVDYFNATSPKMNVEESIAKGLPIIENLYKTLTSIPFGRIPRLFYSEKKMFREIESQFWYKAGKQWGYFYKQPLTWNKQAFEVHIPLCSEVDELAHTTVKKLVKQFGVHIMHIFEAVLLEKRVLFFGPNKTSIQELGEFVQAAAKLVSPPMFGVLQRIFPYCSLSAQEFLKVPGFIAGVTNPMIKQNTRWYDLCCDLEHGLTIPCNPEEYKNQKYYQDDREFIEHLMVKLAEKQIGEEELRFAFAEYAQMILDLALDDYLIFDTAQSKYLADIHWERILRLKKTKSFELQLMLRKQKEQRVVEGVSYSIIELHVRQLKFRKNIAPPMIIGILDDLKNYMKEEEQIIEVLALLPKYREGLNLIAVGLMSPNEEIARKTIEVLDKISSVKVGKEVFANLNPILLQAYYKRLVALKPEILPPH